jgi:pimeloyl-ACP methyl ester carboxylesterase
MMRISQILKFGVFLYLAWITSSHAQSQCAIKGVSFASCSAKARYFRSVVIAIPGWNGSCKSTFGQGEGNLLKVMGRRNFFDVDCFDYDSHHTTLAQSRRLLRDRIQTLHNVGYREFAFVTHSTGGILALDFLLDEALDTNVRLRTGAAKSIIFNSNEGTRLRGFYSWAVPLNGVRTQITMAGKAINLASISPDVLPLLAANSPYLAQLKDRLRIFDNAISIGGHADTASYEFDWVILQGQNDDWIVFNVARTEPWFPSTIHARVVNTESSHSHNVATSGEIGSPLYPGEIMSDKVVLTLGLYPRTNEYFSPSLATTDELARQQRIILYGILAFAENRNLFSKAYTALSEFVVRIFNGKFSRDRTFDEEAVAGLSNLLEKKVNDLDYEDAVDFADRLLNDIEHGLAVDAVGRADGFGAGSYRAVRRLASVINYVFNTVTTLVQQTPALAINLRSSGGSLEVFQTRAANVLSGFLNIFDDETQSRAITGLQSVAADASAGAVTGSGMLIELANYSKRKYRTLAGKPQYDLAQLLSTLTERSGSVNSATFALLNENVEWIKGQQRPLWYTMLTKEQVETLVSTISPEVVASKGQIEFLGSVIASGGAGGKSPQTAVKAIETYGRYLKTAFEGVASEDAAILREAARKASYPSITKNAERALTAAGFD